MAARDALLGSTVESRANGASDDGVNDVGFGDVDGMRAGGAAPEDLANDVTFGDMGDIRAGDAASEQQWAPDHDARAKAIEAEKEAILRLRRQKELQQEHSPSQLEQAQRPNKNGNFPPFQSNQNYMIASHGQIEQQQRQDQFTGPASTVIPLPAMHGLSPGIPSDRSLDSMQQAYAHAMLPQQHQQFSRAPSSGPQRQPDLFELQMQALRQQQQRMQLLQQHQGQSQQPLNQMQMLLQAHQQQAQSQPPRPDGQSLLQTQHQQAPSHPPAPEMQMFIQAQQRQEMHRMRQLQQQQLPPPPQEVQMFMMEQHRLIQQHQNLEPARLRHLLEQHHQQFMAASNARAHAAASVAGFARAPPFPVPTGSTQGRAQATPVRPMPPLPTEALSLAELEQSFRVSRVSENPPRRMKSMTDKDLELVLRMHLRQLDTSIPYRDDFYWTVYEEEGESGPRDMYETLGQHLRDMEDISSAQAAAGVERRRRKRRRAKKRDEKDSASPGIHTSSNLKTLTHALGTIQSWTPKAPRRLMDLGAGDGKAAVPAMHKAMEDDGKSRLMRDDERIAVRVAVENGYDLLSRLQDVTRKKAFEDTDDLLDRLFDTLHLSGKTDHVKGIEPFESTRFFIRMCIFDKGKRYISRLLAVLHPVHVARVVAAVFENLSMLLYAIAPRAVADGPDELWEAVTRAVRSPLIPAERCLGILKAFSRTHADDGGSLVIVLSSTIGARLLYVAMQRIFSAQGDGPPLTANCDTWQKLCMALTAKLGDVFGAAESSKSTWEVAAMLDALSEGQLQADLRSTLKILLDSGRAPPPPGT